MFLPNQEKGEAVGYEYEAVLPKDVWWVRFCIAAVL